MADRFLFDPLDAASQHLGTPGVGTVDADLRGAIQSPLAGPASTVTPGYTAPASPAETETHLLDYVRVLYKRRWLAGSAFMVAFLGAVVYTFTATPMYDARVQLLIEAENQNVISFKEVIEQEKA